MLLGEVEDRFVSVGNGEEDKVIGTGSVDVTPRNEIERLAKRVEVPGVSKEPLNPKVVSEWMF